MTKAKTLTFLPNQRTQTPTHPSSRKTEKEPESFLIDPCHPKQVLRIGSELHPHEKALFKKFFSNNLDVFSWTPTDMPEIDHDIVCHKLSIKEDTKPVKQKLKRMNEQQSCAISDEVDRLLQAIFIRETFYPDWLSNPILVKKKNGKWT